MSKFVEKLEGAKSRHADGRTDEQWGQTSKQASNSKQTKRALLLKSLDGKHTFGPMKKEPANRSVPLVECPWKRRPTGPGGGAVKGSNVPTPRVQSVPRHTHWLILAQTAFCSQHYSGQLRVICILMTTRLQLI